MRSASSRISTASSRSSSATVASSSCAAPRMPDSGFFHLVRQDRRHARHAARGVAEGELAVERARRRRVMQGQHHRARLFRQQRAVHRYPGTAQQPRPLEDQFVLDDGQPVAAHLGDQHEDRMIQRQDLGEAQAAQLRQRQPEEAFRAAVGVQDAITRIEQHHRHRQALHHGGMIRLDTRLRNDWRLRSGRRRQQLETDRLGVQGRDLHAASLRTFSRPPRGMPASMQLS